MAIIPYDRITNLQNDQALAPTDPYPAQKLDQEYNAIKITTDDIIQHLDIIQRDDGQLENDSVGLDQLRDEIIIGFNAPAPWVTDHDYLHGDSVFQDSGFWFCLVDHHSTVFADNVIAGYWSLIADFSTVATTGAPMYVSDGPPALPQQGVQWYESDTGNTYLYYVEPGDTVGQWVQINGAAVGSSGSGLPGSVAGVVNVRDYGALGNGSHDDTAAIQAAVDAAGNNHKGTIFFPPAEPGLYYKTTAPITLSNFYNWIIKGCGQASRIAGSFHGYIFDQLSVPYSAAVNCVKFEDLYIQNGFTGENYTRTASSSWTTGTNKTITVTGHEVTAGCLVYILDQRMAPMPVFVGIVTSVVPSTSITIGGTVAFASPTVKTVTGAANNGSGNVRLTLDGVAQISVGTTVTVSGIVGTTEANGTWVVAAVGANTIDLPVAFANAWVSGGSVSINISLALTQAYAANDTWTTADSTITMSLTKPGSAPTGQCVVYDYNRILYGDGTVPGVYTIGLGTATWSGTTVTFTDVVSQGGTNGLLVFAPQAGCIRISSAVMGTINNCILNGFICVTTSQDNVNASGQLQGAEAYSIVVQGCSMSPSVNSASIGSTAVYLTNNSIVFYCDYSAFWMGTRISGHGCSVIGGRFETCTYGIVTQAEQNTGNQVNTDTVLAGFSMESNTYAILHGGGGHTVVQAIGILCQNSNGQYGVYVGGGDIVYQGCTIQGNWAGYAIYIPDPGNIASHLTFMGVTAANNFGGGLGAWRIPALPWWGTCQQCNNPALVYTYGNLPGVIGGSPTPVEGETYDINNCNTATFLATAAAGGATSAAHRRVRYNASAALWQVVG